MKPPEPVGAPPAGTPPELAEEITKRLRVNFSTGKFWEIGYQADGHSICFDSRLPPAQIAIQIAAMIMDSVRRLALPSAPAPAPQRKGTCNRWPDILHEENTHESGLCQDWLVQLPPDCREAFENWLRAFNSWGNFNRNEGEQGWPYVHGNVELAWQAWQAAHAPSAPAGTPRVHTGIVSGCPAQTVIEECCTCKPGWGHRSPAWGHVAEAKAAGTAPTPREFVHSDVFQALLALTSVIEHLLSKEEQMRIHACLSEAQYVVQEVLAGRMNFDTVTPGAEARASAPPEEK